jgi:poly-gamma-glutamate synthesis protein (capsule biosynthesis protein)
MDFGVTGLVDSLDAAAVRGLPLVGAGTDEESAYAPHVAEVNGQRIAVVGATQVLDDYAIPTWTAGPSQPGLASAKRVDRLVEEVRRARVDADTVVVYVHWGIERETCPSPAQQELAQALVDAGADVVVGAHTHRLQGAGRLDGALVAYGLGNFVFYSSSGPGTHSGVLLVTVRGRDVESYEWIPAVLLNGLPVALPGEAYNEARADWDDLRDCTGLDA